MFEWIMVLSMTGGYNSTSPAITAIPGWQSAGECQSMAVEWMNNTKSTAYVRAICLPQKQPDTVERGSSENQRGSKTGKVGG